MKNVVLKKSLQRAIDITSKNNRLLRLLAQLTYKLQHVDWRQANLFYMKEKLALLGRIGKAYALGHYRDIPWKSILAVVLAILYFVNPLDLIPDMIPVAGLTDDVGVILWVYGSVSKEIRKFLEWERSQIISSEIFP